MLQAFDEVTVADWLLPARFPLKTHSTVNVLGEQVSMLVFKLNDHTSSHITVFTHSYTLTLTYVLFL